MKIKEIKKLIEVLKDTDVNEITIEEEGIKIQVKRQTQTVVNVTENIPASANKVQAAAKQPQPVKEEAEYIRAKMPGTFYKAASPDSEAYVKEGDAINEDSIVCIIEAMKIFNEIKSGVSGKIKKILVKDGEGVEYDQPLFEIEKL